MPDRRNKINDFKEANSAMNHQKWKTPISTSGIPQTLLSYHFFEK